MSEQQKRWTDDQEIAYEVAIKYINEMRGLFSRQMAIIDDEKKKDAYLKRWLELGKEEDRLDGFNDAMIKDVIDTYSELYKEYYNMDDSEEEIAAKGLPEKFLTTKIDYAKYKKDNQ